MKNMMMFEEFFWNKKKKNIKDNNINDQYDDIDKDEIDILIDKYVSEIKPVHYASVDRRKFRSKKHLKMDINKAIDELLSGKVVIMGNLYDDDDILLKIVKQQCKKFGIDIIIEPEMFRTIIRRYIK